MPPNCEFREKDGQRKPLREIRPRLRSRSGQGSSSSAGKKRRWVYLSDYIAVAFAAAVVVFVVFVVWLTSFLPTVLVENRPAMAVAQVGHSSFDGGSPCVVERCLVLSCRSGMRHVQHNVGFWGTCTSFYHSRSSSYDDLRVSTIPGTRYDHTWYQVSLYESTWLVLIRRRLLTVLKGAAAAAAAYSAGIAALLVIAAQGTPCLRRSRRLA